MEYQWSCKCGEQLFERRTIQSVSHILNGSDSGAPFDAISRYIRGGKNYYCVSCGKNVTKEIEELEDK